jgi:stage II sporulation protein AA (anti-sigma F factor antagonist)
MGDESLLTKDEVRKADYIYMVTGRVMIISLNAELDHHLAEEMRDVVDDIIEKRNVSSIVFDFSRIQFMDSAGIGLILGRYKKIKDVGNIYVAGVNESIDRILLISGLHKIIVKCEDINDAVRRVENGIEKINV